MRSHRDLSTRRKLTAIILVTCGVSILFACTMLAVYDVTAFRREISVELVSIAGITGSNTTAALSFGDTNAADKTLNSLAAQTHIVAAAVYAADGSVFARYARAGADPQLVPPHAGPDGIRFSLHDVVVSQPIQLSGERIGTIYLRSDLDQLYARAKNFFEILDIVILACLLAAFLLASRLQRLISEPILALARMAATVSAEKDYSVRATKSGNDEVGSLVDRFNEMLAQIQQRDTALQSAHDQLELRVDERTKELLTQVAERKQAEHSLEERTSFLNSLIENSPIGIVAIDADHFVQMCNPAFERLFQYSRKDTQGRRLSELLSRPEIQNEVDSNRANLNNGKGTHIITRRRRADGTLIDVEAFSVPLFANGKFNGALLLYQDIARTQARRGSAAAREGGRRSRQPRQERIPRQHEPRNPHAHERHHRHDRARARYGA